MLKNLGGDCLDNNGMERSLQCDRLTFSGGDNGG
jgi:hypothetical protein